MKKILFLSILIIQTSIIIAQNNYISKIWGLSSKDESVSDIFEVNSNTFFATVQRDYYIGNIPSESILLKLDSSCNVIDSLKLIKYNKRGLKYLL
jgi:hypothetical protein